MKYTLIRSLIKGEFIKNTLTLSIGTSIGQFFPLLFYPVLGRIYSPVEFGVLATLASITDILTVLASGKYEYSILITRTKKDAVNIVGLVLFLSLPFLLVILIILQLISNQFSIWFNEPDLKKWLFICPISAFAMVIFNCYNEWCVRNKYFVSLSLNKIINSAAVTLNKMLFGFIKIVSNGLVIGDLIGRMTSAAICILLMLRNNKVDFLNISFKRISVLARRYIEFPKYILPGQLLNSIGGQFPVLIIGYYFHSKEVGYYAMAMSILIVPMSVLGVTVRDVFKQRANEEYQKQGNCYKLYIKLFRVLTIWTFLGFIILTFALPIIFTIVLGKQWSVSGEYSQLLCPMIALSFICESLSGVFIITGKMKAALFWQLYYAGVTILSLLIGCLVFRNIKIALICFASGRSSAYLLGILLTYYYSKGLSIMKV